MTSLVDCPEGHGGEWNFRLFGIPVHVKFWFWVAAVVMGAERDPGRLMIWIGVCFVSILIHEFGHVWAFRLFGVRAEAVLYGWGGLAIPDRDTRGTLATFIVSLAGPLAGFCVAALVYALAQAYGVKLHWSFHMLLPSISASPAAITRSSFHWFVLLNDLLFVNFYWGLMNLLPIYPLDGGQAARAVFVERDPYRGRRQSLIVSAAVAGAVMLYGVLNSSYFWAIVFGILAASSLQLLETAHYRRPRPYRSDR